MRSDARVRPDLQRFASTGRAFRGLGSKSCWLGEARETTMREEVFESLLLARPSAKIAVSRWGKKVQGSGPKAPEMKKRRFDWKFPSGGPKKGHFFSVLGVFGPSKPRPPEKNLQENGVFFRMPSFSSSTPFLPKSSSKASVRHARARKSQNQVGQKKFRGPARRPLR